MSCVALGTVAQFFSLARASEPTAGPAAPLGWDPWESPMEFVGFIPLVSRPSSHALKGTSWNLSGSGWPVSGATREILWEYVGQIGPHLALNQMNIKSVTEPRFPR